MYLWLLSFYRWIDWIWIDRSNAIGKTRILWSIIDTIDQKEKNLLPMDWHYRWSAWKWYQSIVAVSFHRRLCPAIVRGRWVVQLFYHTNTSGFLLLPLESGQCTHTSHLPILPGRLPLLLGTGESYTWTIGPRNVNRDSVKEILIGQIRKWQVEIRRRLMSTLAIFQGKRENGEHLVWTAWKRRRPLKIMKIQELFLFILKSSISCFNWGLFNQTTSW